MVEIDGVVIAPPDFHPVSACDNGRIRPVGLLIEATRFVLIIIDGGSLEHIRATRPPVGHAGPPAAFCRLPDAPHRAARNALPDKPAWPIKAAQDCSNVL